MIALLHKRTYTEIPHKYFILAVSYGDKILDPKYRATLDANQLRPGRIYEHQHWHLHEKKIYEAMMSGDTAFHPGRFEMYTLNQLMREYCDNHTRHGNGTGSIDVRKTVDIGKLQADYGSMDTVFQVASNLNCLEGGVAQYNRDKSATNYAMRRTPVQGERASMSAAAGAIYRRYMGINSDLLQFTYGRSNNFIRLDDFGTFKIDRNEKKGGRYNEKAMLQATRNERAFSMAFTPEIACGFQVGVQVSGRIVDRTNHTIEYYSNKNRTFINQAFTAAFDWGNFHKHNKHVPSNVVESLVLVNSCLLFSSYASVILWAILNDVKTVYLTAVGASAFANRKVRGITNHQAEVVRRIIILLHALYPIIKKYDLRVIVNADKIYDTINSRDGSDIRSQAQRKLSDTPPSTIDEFKRMMVNAILL